jgi:hypothetical protein
MEGSYLAMSLDAAIPLWMVKYWGYSPEERQTEIDELNASDFSSRMEYILHEGPKEGDTSKAFNDLARSVALLSFAPGGVTAFGRHWEAGRRRAGSRRRDSLREQSEKA